MTLDLMTGHYPGHRTDTPPKRLPKMTNEVALKIKAEWESDMDKYLNGNGKRPLRKYYAKKYGANDTTVGMIISGKWFERMK